MKQEIIDTIKSRGYWRINFQPLVDKKQFGSLGECGEIVQKCQVSLRGWNYPHIPPHKKDDESAGVEAGNNFYTGWTNWWNHIEFWRMYESGQFLHYVALREDWAEKSGWGIVENSNEPSSKYLGIVGTIYEITEIFEFLSRLAQKGVYDDGVEVSVSLHNLEKRALKMEDEMRNFFMSNEYQTGLEEISFSKTYNKEELVTKPQELALEAILHFFDRFNWHKPPIEVIRKDQDTLLSRNF